MNTIHARLGPDGRLSEVSHRLRVHADDVPLVAMPQGLGPWSYDAGERRAIAAGLSPDERLECVRVPGRVLAALVLRLSSAWERCTEDERSCAQRLLDQGGAGALASLRPKSS